MPKHRSEKKSKDEPNPFVCKPLDSFSEIMMFLENPPPWRTLCKEMTPHSNSVVRNMEVNVNETIISSFDIPDNFCHYKADDVEEDTRYDTKRLPKTLVCHDMANGYHDDSIIEGSPNGEAYTFYNWAGIDIFCYFSHHLITIPPVGWINIGHMHGVKVIGTLITEWADGMTFWEEMLASETEYQNLANALVAIAKTLKFDGYLLNVENKVSKPEVLLQFVRYLHKLIHTELEYGILLWYDSVTVHGHLNWQNCLNEKNKPFFDACDGFFTNYSWSVEDVQSSAVVANTRINDLFIGIDVWGRNFYGGGQFNTQEAVKVAYAEGCSLAIFAPGWTFEANPAESSETSHVHLAEDLDTYGQCLLRDRALWDTIWPFLNTKLPCMLPFQTSFCRGQGKKRYMYGEVLSPSPWYNLRHQQYQPNAAHGQHGYILTSIDTILKVQRSGQYKDKKGIIRYRASFALAQTRSLHRRSAIARSTTEYLPPTNLDDDYVSTTTVVKDEVLPANPDTVLAPDDSDQRDTKKEKTTVKDTIKKMFKHKTLRIDENAVKVSAESLRAADSSEHIAAASPGTSAEEAPPEAQASGTDKAVGRSMVRMSINLRLGTVHEKTRFSLAHVSDERECLELYLHDAFTGGSCLKVNPSDVINKDHRLTRLFFCEFPCEDTLIVCVVTKPLPEHIHQTLNVNLLMKNAQDEDLTVVLTGRDLVNTTSLDANSVGIKYLYPLNGAGEEVLCQLRHYLLLNQPAFYVPIDNCYGWSVRYYEVTVPGSVVTCVTLRTEVPEGGILLGHFGICRKIHK